jgi:peptidoglycan hydrolase-like protein with peptidoglycan-binding domain
MAVLKKGSKGQDVKHLQEYLNKNGAKPKLKVDSIFGPLTEAAVKAWQKKAKLKTDGVVGKKTAGALIYGGPLPVMPVRDYDKIAKQIEKTRKHNKQVVQRYSEMNKAAAKLAKLLSTSVPDLEKSLKERNANFDKIDRKITEVWDHQQDFKVLVYDDPHQAAKLGKICQKLDAEIVKMVVNDIVPSLDRDGATIDDLKTAMEACSATLSKALADIKAGGLDLKG